MGSFIKYQRLTILWSAVILIMCSISMGKVGESHLFFAGFDKMVHCGFFFVFVILSANGYQRQTGDLSTLGVFSIAFIGLFFGALIEVLQKFIFTWREPSLDDLFADFVGIGMATFSILVIKSAIKYVKA